MKLEKREITLNEADSLKDVFYLEKTVLAAYADALCAARTKEEKDVLLRLMREAGEDLHFIITLTNKTQA